MQKPAPSLNTLAGPRPSRRIAPAHPPRFQLVVSGEVSLERQAEIVAIRRYFAAAGLPAEMCGYALARDITLAAIVLDHIGSDMIHDEHVGAICAFALDCVETARRELGLAE